MANRKIYMVALYMMVFNLFVPVVDELGIWDTGDLSYVSTNIDSINTSIVELTDVSDIEETDTTGLSVFELPGMMIKALVMILKVFKSVLLIGIVMFEYGIPWPLCLVFQSLNIYSLSVLYSEFIANRSASR